MTLEDHINIDNITSNPSLIKTSFAGK
jgi:hypothetical protein